MPQPSNARKLVISVAMPFAFFGGLELALFLADFSHRPAEVPIMIWSPAQGGALQDQQGILHSDPLSLWSPRPRAVIPWDLAERVNAAGFRGPELPLERAPGILRIAALGDSSTFGFGVPNDSSYPARLEGLLAERGLPAEVLNAGVVGFTVSQGLERYRHHVRPYRPDVVVAAFSAVNEHHAAVESDERKIEFSQRRITETEGRRRIMPERLRVQELAACIAYKLRGGQAVERERFRQLRRRTSSSLSTVGQADWPETRRVSVERFRELTRTLAREVEADGAELILVVMPRRPPVDSQLPVLPLYSQALRELAASEGIPLCDAQRAFREADRGCGEAAPLFLPRDRWHPSHEGHAIIAEELAPLIEATVAWVTDGREGGAEHGP